MLTTSDLSWSTSIDCCCNICIWLSMHIGIAKSEFAQPDVFVVAWFVLLHQVLLDSHMYHSTEIYYHSYLLNICWTSTLVRAEDLSCNLLSWIERWTDGLSPPWGIQKKGSMEKLWMTHVELREKVPGIHSYHFSFNQRCRANLTKDYWPLTSMVVAFWSTQPNLVLWLVCWVSVFSSHGLCFAFW